jgi:hypothetical protein
MLREWYELQIFKSLVLSVLVSLPLQAAYADMGIRLAVPIIFVRFFFGLLHSL